MEQPSPSSTVTFRRPLGVTIIVGLAVFRGVVGLWASIAVVGVLRTLGTDAFSLLNFTWLAIAVMYLVFALGAWTLKAWAWILGVGLTAGSILLELFGLLTEGQPIYGTLISMAISAVILFFLLQPDVRRAFGRG